MLDGYVFDTNALSLLAKANHLGLLDAATVPLYITPAIQQELEVGVQRGVSYLDNVLDMANDGQLQIIVPDRDDDRKFM